MADTHKKSAFKALSWRVIASLATSAISFAITGKWEFALSIGAADIVIKLILYYLHERAWARVK